MEENEVQEQSFEYAATVSAVKAADHLEALARNLRAGQVQLTAGAESIALAVQGEVKLEIAAEFKAEKGKGSLELQLSWRNPIARDEAEIQIGGGAPAKAAGAKGSKAVEPTEA
jgi:amphi-Trp domain-containing protein